MNLSRMGAAAAAVGAALLSACSAPVNPVREEVRRTVTGISADLSGVKHSDTGNLGARGSEEGASKGAAQAMSQATSLLGLLILPIVGGAAGAASARPAEEVDPARANIRLAIQETDFNEMLRQRLMRSTAGGQVRVVDVSSGGTGGPASPGASHVVTLEYQLGIVRIGAVVPDVTVIVAFKGQLLSPDRQKVLHSNTWVYCGDFRNFIEAGQNSGAHFRTEMQRAAQVIGDAILYDLFVNNEPRGFGSRRPCLNFNNLPPSTDTDFAPPPTSTSSRPPAGPAPTSAAAPPLALTPVSTSPQETPAASEARRRIEEDQRRLEERQRALENEKRLLEEERRAAEDKRRQTEAQRVAAATPPPAPAPTAEPTPAPPARTVAVQRPALPPGTDGGWRGTYDCKVSTFASPVALDVDMRVVGGKGSAAFANNGSLTHSLSLQISGNAATFERVSDDANGRRVYTRLRGPVSGDAISFTANEETQLGPNFMSSFNNCTVSLTRGL